MTAPSRDKITLTSTAINAMNKEKIKKYQVIRLKLSYFNLGLPTRVMNYSRHIKSMMGSTAKF